MRLFLMGRCQHEFLECKVPPEMQESPNPNITLPGKRCVRVQLWNLMQPWRQSPAPPSVSVSRALAGWALAACGRKGF